MKTTSITIALMLSAGLTIQANPITKAEARLVAEQLVGINDTSDDNVATAPFYIFSRGQGQGFVIASGDDSTAPILGYTEQGDYDPDDMPPQLKAMLLLWQERIGEVQCRPQTGRQRISAPRRAIADYKKGWVDVTPLLKTHWHQSTPYNNLAPIKQGVGRCMSGCVATSGSQVTYYFRKDNPTELAYDTPTYSYGTPITVSLPKGTPIEWNMMKLSGTGTAKQDSAVAKLMYALGTSAWLTYGDGDGLATSGYNSNMAEAMKGQFRLNYNYSGKGSYSQKAWEELIYKNLVSKRPMLYSGANSEGGHSVCLDGYQASTGLYHFNFGWGGQGDGYYTVDDATGMNGYNTYQDLVYDITPQVQNLEGKMSETKLFHKANSNVEVTVTNHGTLDYQGLYVYVTENGTATGTAAATDTETIIEAGKSVTVSLPVNTGLLLDSAYVVLCDKNRRILAKQKMRITPTVADMHLNGITVDGSAGTTVVDSITFHNVNNTMATVTVTLTNGKNGTYCQPKLQCILQRYLATTKKWMNMSAKTITTSSNAFDPGQTQSIDFVFTSLGNGFYYRACLSSTAEATSSSDIQVDCPDTCVYFTTRLANINIAVSGRTANVTGCWNAKLFTSLATDASITSYDISGLTELNAQPVAANPNALFYTTAQNVGEELQSQLPDMHNIVVDDVCQRLTLRTGADFKPMQPFTAKEASLTLSDAEPGAWKITLLPFAADVPYGIQMKKATDYTTSGIATVNHEATRNVEAMSVVTFLTSRKGLDTITATDVPVTTDTVATFFDGILQASTLETELQPTSLVPGIYAASLYFIAPEAGQTSVEAFLPVVSGVTAQRVRTTSETLVDGYYRSLSTVIDAAYDTLAAHPRTAKAAVMALQAEITVAQDMLTYRTHQDNTDIKNERDVLSKAIKTFIEAAEEEDVYGDVNGDGVVDVADIATIISVMAGDATLGGVAHYADVNRDGAVDVADIASIISIMAGSIQ